jgi:hypothetical protein
VHKHPGGAFVLSHNVGRDISKFFYGGYALDGNSSNPKDANSRHTHSNVARKIVNDHIVAVLVSTENRNEAHEGMFSID